MTIGAGHGARGLLNDGLDDLGILFGEPSEKSGDTHGGRRVKDLKVGGEREMEEKRDWKTERGKKA